MSISFDQLAAGNLGQIERKIKALGALILVNELSTGEFERLQEIDDEEARTIEFLIAGLSDGSDKRMTAQQAKNFMENNTFKAVREVLNAIFEVNGVEFVTGDEDSPGNG